MLHRALQCLVCWKGWQINKILWTYKRKEEGKEERREETFKECKSVPSSLEEGQGKRSLFFKSPHLLLLCHLRRTTFTSAASPAGRPIVIVSFISASARPMDKVTGSQWFGVWHCHVFYTVWWFDAFQSVTSPCKDVCNSIFRHKGRARSKPLELSTLAFLSPLQKACESNEGVLMGAAGGSGKYRALMARSEVWRRFHVHSRL